MINLDNNPSVWFQHTAARRRLAPSIDANPRPFVVSTHSRPKAAGQINIILFQRFHVSTHSRPKAAGHKFTVELVYWKVSTHSRPKAAGKRGFEADELTIVSTHSRPKAAGLVALILECLDNMFQHTAARRRLAKTAIKPIPNSFVSTHSRPKAAGGLRRLF